MVHRDGNIGAWLDDQQAAIAKLSARNIGVHFPPEWYRTFLRTLDGDPDAGSLRDFLPRCNVPALASFTVLIVSTPIEEALLGSTRKRGQELKGMLRVGVRKGEQVRERLAKAEDAFDVRRQGLGLGQYSFGLLILRGYIQHKCGRVPSARDLATLLRAGLAASGKFSKFIDYDLLRRNLRNYEKRHADRCRLATGERCVEIIESSSK